ncbi:8-amino-7-oxononanoate synthase [Providencia stuartii]|nr:8-amino-7-oxononanoate synthase [Providencia stuartii]
MPPAQAVALSAALQQIRTADDARERLNQHIEYFRKNSQFSDLQLADSQMAIQPVIVGDNEVSLQLSDYLRQKGLWVQAIRPPTVPTRQCTAPHYLECSSSPTRYRSTVGGVKWFYH